MVDVRRLPVGEHNECQVTLDDLAREGARRMIAAALEAEVEQYVYSLVEEVDEDGKRLVVRNGRARERKVTVGSGTLVIRAPRVNDKRVNEDTGQRKRFSSRILPAYARRSPKVTEVLPILYLHGLSTGDFGPALRDLLGEDASGLSPSSIQRLTEAWQAEHAAFRTRELRFHRYAYLFVDGVNVSVRLGEDDRLCLLVVIGVLRGWGEGAAGHRGRLPRVGRLLGGRVPRPARAWSWLPEAGHRRRRAGRVGRTTRRVPAGASTTLLGA
jgi:transposase-like protein